MKIKGLEIQRRPSYDSDFPNQLVGIVELSGPTGSQNIVLSSMTIASIFSLIKTDVEKTALGNAKQAGRALDDAAGEFRLLEVEDINI